MKLEYQYVIPTYIDTNALLDLLASIEGGFSMVEKISTQISSKKEIQKELGAEAGTEFGIPNVLSLLRVGLHGSIGGKSGDEVMKHEETQRYHTYGSLLYRLRTFLSERGLLKVVDSPDVWEQLHPSDFAEIHGLVRPNPLSDSLERLDRLMAIFELLGGAISTSPRSKGIPKHDLAKMKQIRGFFKGILKDIEQEKVRKFVSDLYGVEGARAVALLFTDYLRDKTLSEIAHKEYRLLGKVVRKINPDDDTAIDLLAGTGLGGIGEQALSQLLESFDQAEGISFPKVETQIGPPALEIVPIAIFV